MANSLAVTWQQLRAALETASGELLSACDEAREQTEVLRSELEIAFRDAEPPASEPGRLESLLALYDEPAARLLRKPLDRRESVLPQKRVIDAFESYLSALERVVEDAPQEIVVSDEDLANCFGRRPASAAVRKWFGRQPAIRRLPVRDAFMRALASRRTRLLRRMGELLLGLTQLEEALTDPWEATLDEGLRRLDGTGEDPKEYDHDKRRWFVLGERRRREARAAVADLRHMLSTLPPEVAGELAGSCQPQDGDKRSRLRATLASARNRLRWAPTDQTRDCIAFWRRRDRAIGTLFDLSIAQVRLGEELAEAAASAVAQLDAERQALFGELDLVANTLSTWDGSLDLDFLPTTVVLPKAAGERIREWSAAVRRVATTLLPEEAELADARGVLPRGRAPWRLVRPLDALLNALESASEPSQLSGLDRAERLHQSVVSEIDHARQVVYYGLESAAEEGELRMAREAVSNALDLLNRRRSHLAPSVEPAEASLTEASAAMLSRCGATITEGRLGLLRRLARQRGPRLVSEFGGRTIAALRKASRRTWTTLGRVQRWVLIRIGWDRPPETRLAPVDRRPWLHQELSASRAAAELPLIYARLFRPEPVRHPRFLIGRREEMEALRECRRSWEAGRPTAVLIVGERGSGKTSLINCAKADVFKTLPIVTAAFDERIVTADQMDAFLRETFDIAKGEDLLEGLRRERRVIVLEELERAFLRRIGGFEGLERLLSVISKTKHAVLWCVAINQAGFVLADAAIGMNRGFSHRINARAVSAEHLRRAILQRHDLSGLALHFRSTTAESRFSRVHAFLGLEGSPRDEFFDALYDQSRGVFRSAFQLWRAAMTVTAHGLRLQTPNDFDMESLKASLAVEDLFALHAVLQHGALTPDEYAEIFQLAPEGSADCLNRLSEMGVLEIEKNLGLRVRPEAAPLVRSLLDGSNLL